MKQLRYFHIVIYFDLKTGEKNKRKQNHFKISETHELNEENKYYNQMATKYGSPLHVFDPNEH